LSSFLQAETSKPISHSELSPHAVYNLVRPPRFRDRVSKPAFNPQPIFFPLRNLAFSGLAPFCIILFVRFPIHPFSHPFTKDFPRDALALLRSSPALVKLPPPPPSFAERPLFEEHPPSFRHRLGWRIPIFHGSAFSFHALSGTTRRPSTLSVLHGLQRTDQPERRQTMLLCELCANPSPIYANTSCENHRSLVSK